MRSILVLIAAVGTQACQRERTVKHEHRRVKRQSSNVTFPPVLDTNEQVLVNSFDNASISTWSYYYSKLGTLHREHCLRSQHMVLMWLARTELWHSGQPIAGPSTDSRRD